MTGIQALGEIRTMLAAEVMSIKLEQCKMHLVSV